MADHYLLVVTTLAKAEEAEKIAALMVKKRLAACAQVEGPITSIYWWKNSLEKEREWKCSFKTSVDLFPELEKALKQSHPYETPEIVGVPIKTVSQEYRAWMKAELKS